MDVAMEEPPLSAIAADSSVKLSTTNTNVEPIITNNNLVELNKEPSIKNTRNDAANMCLDAVASSSVAIKSTITSAVVSSTTTNTTPTEHVTKTQLKRCLSVPNIGRIAQNTSSMTLRSAATAATATRKGKAMEQNALETPKKNDTITTAIGTGNPHMHIHVPRSNPSSREVSPAPMFNIFAPRARRYSASFSPLGGLTGVSSTSANGAPLYLTPRVSQLRQEECADVNTREINHEREVHTALQMSQSWEDLTLVAENWSCKSDEFSNPLQVALPASINSCSSPSPTNHRASVRLPYGLSPSPTRRTFATRRSMSPIAMRPSQLGPVKRKFDLDDQNNSSSNWSVYSPPPLKKFLTDSRGTSPICQSPSSVCPSPDSGTYDGRVTPKLFISKLCTANATLPGANTSSYINSSTCSSPISSSNMSLGLGKPNFLPNAQIAGGSEPMCIGGSQVDEGISMSDSAVTTSSSAASTPVPVTSDLQDEVTMMDDTKSETSSIGGCSSISMESNSSNSFFNKFNSDSEVGNVTSSLVPKHFFINKSSGLSGAKKFIVNHDHSDSNLSVSSTTATMVGNAELLEGRTPPTIMVDNKI